MVTFVHGHQESWHSADLNQTLRTLRWEGVRSYTDLNRKMSVWNAKMGDLSATPDAQVIAELPDAYNGSFRPGQVLAPARGGLLVQCATHASSGTCQASWLGQACCACPGADMGTGVQVYRGKAYDYWGMHMWQRVSALTPPRHARTRMARCLILVHRCVPCAGRAGARRLPTRAAERSPRSSCARGTGCWGRWGWARCRASSSSTAAPSLRWTVRPSRGAHASGMLACSDASGFPDLKHKLPHRRPKAFWQALVDWIGDNDVRGNYNNDKRYVVGLVFEAFFGMLLGRSALASGWQEPRDLLWPARTHAS